MIDSIAVTKTSLFANDTMVKTYHKIAATKISLFTQWMDNMKLAKNNQFRGCCNCPNHKLKNDYLMNNSIVVSKTSVYANETIEKTYHRIVVTKNSLFAMWMDNMQLSSDKYLCGHCDGPNRKLKNEFKSNGRNEFVPIQTEMSLIDLLIK